MSSSQARDLPPAARQEGRAARRPEGAGVPAGAARRAGGAATRPVVPCVPPGAASVCHATGLTSANMQQLRQYDRPPIIGNGEQSSQCVFSDNFPVLSSYQPDVVQSVCVQ